jgi:regulation of enolase protein 1 (concanavalin A-like superfamily)
MKLMSCRKLMVCLVAASAMAGLGLPVLSAQTASPAPKLVLLRNANLTQNVWPGDFNGDGITDLAATAPSTADNTSGHIIVALGRGDGTFQAPRPAPYIGSVRGTGDFNRDGRLDLIVASDPAPDVDVSILLGNGDGTFSASRSVGSAADVTFAIGADLDGDGNRDLIVGSEGEAVSIYAGRSDGTFSGAITIATGTSPHGAILADFDGDGTKDIAIANHYGNSVTILLNRGGFTFAAVDVPVGAQANGVTAADVNGDGRTDLVAALSAGGDGDTWFDEGYAAVLIGRGDGTFAAPVRYDVPRGAWRVVIGDFTHDGILDVATANRSSLRYDDCGSTLKTWDSLSILPGRSDGTFAAASSFSIGSQPGVDDPSTDRNRVTSLNTSDVNGDHSTDLVVSSGAVFLTQPAGPNRAPVVDAGPDRVAGTDHSAILRATADDPDQDMLTYAWIDSGGDSIPPVPNPCFTPRTLGRHILTVTVDDGHGHRTSDAVTVDFSAPPEGGSGGTVAITSPSAGETVRAGGAYTIRWTSAGDVALASAWNILIVSDNGTTRTPIPECRSLPADARQCAWTNPAAAARVQLAIVNDAGDSAPIAGSSGVFDVVLAAGDLPFPWRHQDVGAVAAAGGASYDGSAFTVTGSGADVWGAADEFQFVYQQVTAAFEITARVDSVQNVQAWTKAGLMVRTSLGPDAPQASIFITPGKGLAFQRRASRGALSVSTSGPADITGPVWLRLTGYNGNMWAYYRKNLTDPWTFIGQQALTTSSTAYVGFAVTSHADGATATAAFSHALIGTIPSWSGPVAIGTSSAGASYDGTIYGLSARGSDIWGTADAFTYLGTPLVGDGTIVARVNSVDGTSVWAKAGVMFRESSAPGSKHVFAMVTPGKGVNLQYRAETNGASTAAAATAGAPAGWVRLTRAGDTFTAAWSTDGITFSEFGRATVVMSRSLQVGLAATSHDETTSGDARFDDVEISNSPW